MRRSTMKARLFVLSGTAIGSLVLAAATTAAGGGSAVTPVLKTIGFTDILAPTARCGEYVARVQVGRQVGTSTAVVGSDVVRAPVMVPVGTTTFCVRSRVDSPGPGERRTTATGILTLTLPGGAIEALFSETQTARVPGKTAYSSLMRITRGRGRYRDATGVIRGSGSVSVLSSARQCWKLTFRLELV
jgi:hypothetical protein